MLLFLRIDYSLNEFTDDESQVMSGEAIYQRHGQIMRQQILPSFFIFFLKVSESFKVMNEWFIALKQKKPK